jgi:hypothetical protein
MPIVKASLSRCLLFAFPTADSGNTLNPETFSARLGIF